MKQSFIVIDGKTYKSVDEMPADIRAKYEEAMRSLDQNRNNTPDLFENPAPSPSSLPNMMSAAQILVNGQAYNGLDQLPPEIRAQYEQAMGAMDANRNGIPDFVENMLNLPAQMTSNSAMSVGTSTPQPAQPFGNASASRPPQIATSTIEPESSGGWLLALTSIGLIVMCLVAAAAGVWYFFLR
jgi:hypothetical protein